MNANTLTRRYGRLLFVGKGPAISAQLQAMARREGFHIEFNPAASESATEAHAPDNPMEAHHEVTPCNSNLSTRVTPLRKASPVLTAVDRKVIAALDALKPVACVPGFQDVDADGDFYFAGLSGRLA